MDTTKALIVAFKKYQEADTDNLINKAFFDVHEFGYGNHFTYSGRTGKGKVQEKTVTDKIRNNDGSGYQTGRRKV